RQPSRAECACDPARDLVRRARDGARVVASPGCRRARPDTSSAGTVEQHRGYQNTFAVVGPTHVSEEHDVRASAPHDVTHVAADDLVIGADVRGDHLPLELAKGNGQLFAHPAPE